MKIDKGVYGTRSGAVSYEIWFEDKAINQRQFAKCYIARSVYLKVVEDAIVRLFRHSDDCKLPCINQDIASHEQDELSKLIRMSKWTKPEMFLGCTIEYGDHIVLLR
jgi:hypothetical protein